MPRVKSNHAHNSNVVDWMTLRLTDFFQQYTDEKTTCSEVGHRVAEQKPCEMELKMLIEYSLKQDKPEV